jgi:hypothetical protein
VGVALPLKTSGTEKKFVTVRADARNPFNAASMTPPTVRRNSTVFNKAEVWFGFISSSGFKGRNGVDI